MPSLEELKFYAKYPFTSEAKSHLSGLKINIAEIGDEKLQFTMKSVSDIIKKTQSASQKLKEISDSKENYLTNALMSYPVGNILMSISGNNVLKMMYARNFAAQVQQMLVLDDPKVAEKVVSGMFEINDSTVSIFDYLKYLPYGSASKLVYQELHEGRVKLTSQVANGMIAEKVFQTIMAANANKKDFPKDFIFYSNEISKLKQDAFDENLGEVNVACYPPCMKQIIADLQTAVKVGHMPRFVLATFLVNIGMKEDEIVKIFSKQENFKESLVRYHIKNIAGSGASSKKYSVPACAKMESYGTCCRNETCKWKSPMGYYKVMKKRGKR